MHKTLYNISRVGHLPSPLAHACGRPCSRSRSNDTKIYPLLGFTVKHIIYVISKQQFSLFVKRDRHTHAHGHDENYTSFVQLAHSNDKPIAFV